MQRTHVGDELNAFASGRKAEEMLRNEAATATDFMQSEKDDGASTRNNQMHVR